MKIVEVISQMRKRGGAEVFYASLCMELSKSNDVYLIVLHAGIDPSFGFLKQRFGSHLYVCNKKNGLDLKCANFFKGIIKSINPDVVHSHGQCAITYLMAFGINKTKFKYFHTMHSIAQKEASSIDRLAKKILLKFNRINLIAISNEVKKTVEKVYKKPCPSIENGIDQSDFSKSKKHQHFIGNFICVAGFRPVKNHIFLIKAFARLRNEGYHFDLTCCGDGETLDEIKAFTKKLNLDKAIHFVGQVDSTLPYLENNDCLVLSSIYEGNPLSVLEAMSAGLPIIAPRVGGLPDIVTNKSGLLYTPNALDSLVDALKFFYKNSETYPSFSNAALCESTKFGISCCSKRYEDLFKEKLL